jgi:hypothetical protein
MSAGGASDRCSVDANSASDRASRAVGCANRRRALASISHFSFFIVVVGGTEPVGGSDRSPQPSSGQGWGNLASSVNLPISHSGNQCAAALAARPAMATAISSARAVMMLSQRDCRPRGLPGVTWTTAAAVSARLIGAATRRYGPSQVSIANQGDARCDRAGRGSADRPGSCRGDGGEDADDTGERQPPFAAFVHAAHDRGHGGIVESGKRRPLRQGAEHVGAVDDPGSQHAGEGGDGCEQVHGSPREIGSHGDASSSASLESSRRTEIRQSPRSRILASSPCSAG